MGGTWGYMVVIMGVHSVYIGFVLGYMVINGVYMEITWGLYWDNMGFT